MDSYRDWGHSYDYVRAMHAILNHDEADDFVVSTMETHSVREMCDYVFGLLDLDYKDYVIQNPKFLKFLSFALLEVIMFFLALDLWA